MTSKLTLYWDVHSSTCKTVKVLIDIAKIPCHYQYVNLLNRQTSSTQFLQINPLGTIPFLKNGNFGLSQTAPILIYLYQTCPNIPRSYYGTTQEERANVNQYLSWFESFFKPNVQEIIYLIQQSIATGKPIIKDHLDASTKAMEEGMEQLEKILTGKKYMASNTFTIADLVFIFPVINAMFYSSNTTKYKAINRWFRNVYKMRKVKRIILQWFPLGQQLHKSFRKVSMRSKL